MSLIHARCLPRFPPTRSRSFCLGPLPILQALKSDDVQIVADAPQCARVRIRVAPRSELAGQNHSRKHRPLDGRSKRQCQTLARCRPKSRNPFFASNICFCQKRVFELAGLAPCRFAPARLLLAHNHWAGHVFFWRHRPLFSPPASCMPRLSGPDDCPCGSRKFWLDFPSLPRCKRVRSIRSICSCISSFPQTLRSITIFSSTSPGLARERFCLHGCVGFQRRAQVLAALALTLGGLAPRASPIRMF